MILYSLIDSPLDPLLLTSDGAALTGLYLIDHARGPLIGSDWRRDDELSIFAATQRQLNAYFAGELQHFDLPLAPRGTLFQQRVWAALHTIPYGATTSYGALAQQIEQPNAARAVGAANGRNPLSLIVPCHRVVGAGGVLTGYAGGLHRKAALLRFEAAVVAGGAQSFAAQEWIR